MSHKQRDSVGDGVLLDVASDVVLLEVSSTATKGNLPLI